MHPLRVHFRFGGGERIRTSDALRHTCFQDKPFQPLTHASLRRILNIAEYNTIFKNDGYLKCIALSDFFIYNKTMEKENLVFLTTIDEERAHEEYLDELTAEQNEADNEEEMPEQAIGRITWEAPEFEHVEKSTTWYWGSMAVAIVLIAIALWQKNFLFAVFIVVAELVVFMFAGEKPKPWNFTIDERGVTIENHKTYKYTDITLYDIHEFSDEYHELVLQTRSKVHHYIKIFIPVDLDEEIDDLLSEKIRRGEIEVSFLEILERLIGF